MKGWIYVIPNRAMPGLVKIGYSIQDPVVRAEELDHTGSPHPYVVEYEMLTERPHQVEQEIHQALSTCCEGKEWFSCTLEESIVAIRKVAGRRAITETLNITGEKQLKDIQATLDNILSNLSSLEFYLGSKEEKRNPEIIQNRVQNLKALTRVAKQQIRQVLAEVQRFSAHGR